MGFALDANIACVAVRISEVFYSALACRKPSSLAGLGVDFLGFPFFVSELEMSGGENRIHATRMVVERRFFLRAVRCIDHPHVFISKSQLIVPWVQPWWGPALTQKE